jgi:hypothetical protein
MTRKPFVRDDTFFADLMNLLTFRPLYRKKKIKKLHNYLIDMIEIDGTNRFFCQCGKQLYPACDMSLLSINQCYEEHYFEETGEHIP